MYWFVRDVDFEDPDSISVMCSHGRQPRQHQDATRAVHTGEDFDG